jgi:hypothetical protein
VARPKEVVVKVAWAWLPEPESVPVPRVVPPSRKVIVPVGVGPVEELVTVAVKVRLCPG